MEEREGARVNSAFVAHTDFGSHSMFHQRLIPSPPPFPSSTSASFSSSSPSPSLLFTSPLLLPSSLAEKESRMEVLRSSLRPEVAEEMAAAAVVPAGWGGERGGGFLGDGFSVEELLDLGEFAEPEKEADAAAAAGGSGGGGGGEAGGVEEDGKANSNDSSSVVSYELMPPPPPPTTTEIDLPAHDAEELEWVSRIMDDSLSELPPQPPPAAAAGRPPQPRVAHRRVQEGPANPMRSPTICALSTEALVPVKAKRSKRTRAAVWSLSGPPPFSDSTSSSSTTTTTSSCSSSASFPSVFLYDSHFAPDGPPAFLVDGHRLLPPPPKKYKKSKNSKHKPKKRGRKPKHQPPHLAGAGAAFQPVPGDRRCSHCGVQKTPQWRAGPQGAKTLCNACGVRYKSGRLLPEYRPACSPTFVSTVHSNSHRKVLEMRRKKEATLLAVAAPPVASF